MNTKFAIGCLIQWYEIEIIEEYLDSLKDAVNSYEGEVLVNFTLVTNTDLEKPTSPTICMYSTVKLSAMIHEKFDKYVFNVKETLYTIADYRRDFNREYCTEVDVLVWGESDMLVPKDMFFILDGLHSQVGDKTPKYISTFAICKMWDDSWKPLEHPEFTDKPFIENDTENWWSLRYTMSKEEMNKINSKVETPDVVILQEHKYNGCGLVISSEIVKAGVNIPPSIFFVHEDSAFMLILKKLLPTVPQYHVKNILLVHNRKHPKKRMYIRGEEEVSKTDTGAQRRVHPWYAHANKMCEHNAYTFSHPDKKSYTWKDVWKAVKE